MQKVYVIIINYRSHLVILDAIKSIKEDSLEIKIIIMDNENSNESRLALQAIDDERVEVVSLEENIGFARACNKGYLHILKKYYDLKYIFLLNPDAVIQTNMIYGLYKDFSHKNIAVVSPTILDLGGNVLYNGLVINYDKCTVNPLVNYQEDEMSHQVDIFHGCSALIDAEKFYEVGMFNENIFMYFDEGFLSMELKKMSYEIIYDMRYSVKHHVSYSSSEYGFYKAYYHSRNHICFFKEYGKGNVFCKYISVLKNFLSSLKHIQFKRALGISYGILHSVINRYGKL